MARGKKGYSSIFAGKFRKFCYFSEFDEKNFLSSSQKKIDYNFAIVPSSFPSFIKVLIKKIFFRCLDFQTKPGISSLSFFIK